MYRGFLCLASWCPSNSVLIFLYSPLELNWNVRHFMKICFVFLLTDILISYAALLIPSGTFPIRILSLTFNQFVTLHFIVKIYFFCSSVGRLPYQIKDFIKFIRYIHFFSPPLNTFNYNLSSLQGQWFQPFKVKTWSHRFNIYILNTLNQNQLFTTIF